MPHAEKDRKHRSLNPYSNGTMYLIGIYTYDSGIDDESLNPYSNGTMYLIRVIAGVYHEYGLNPYSNGTMYLILLSL